MDHCTCSPDRIMGIELGDLCAKHDKVYEKKCCWYHKLGSDFMLGIRIWLRGLRYMVGGFLLMFVAPIYTIATLTIGHIIWRGKNGKR